jgi:hypothetical protein
MACRPYQNNFYIPQADENSSASRVKPLQAVHEVQEHYRRGRKGNWEHRWRMRRGTIGWNAREHSQDWGAHIATVHLKGIAISWQPEQLVISQKFLLHSDYLIVTLIALSMTSKNKAPIKLSGLSPRANLTDERAPLIGEISSNFCG